MSFTPDYKQMPVKIKGPEKNEGAWRLEPGHRGIDVTCTENNEIRTQ